MDTYLTFMDNNDDPTLEQFTAQFKQLLKPLQTPITYSRNGRKYTRTLVERTYNEGCR